MCNITVTKLLKFTVTVTVTDMRHVSLQTAASGGVEGGSGEERVRGVGGNLRTGLRQGGQQGRRRHLGGAAPL